MSGTKKPMTSAERQAIFRAKKKEQLGADNYNKLQNERIKKYRDSITNKPETPFTISKTDPEKYLKELSKTPVPDKKKESSQKLTGLNEYVDQINLDDIDDCRELEDLIYENKATMAENDDKKHIKPSTIKSYIKMISNLHEKMEIQGKFNCDNLAWTKDYINVIKFILNYEWEKSTKQNYFNALSSVLKEIKGYEIIADKYVNIMTILKKEMTEEGDENKLSEREELNYVKWENIKDIYTKTKDIDDKIILALYTIIPPRRGTDYRLMKVITSEELPTDDNFNYLHIKTKSNYQFIFNVYKTSPIYGLQSFKVPPILRGIINDFIKSHKIKNGDLLFSTQDWREMSQGNFSAMIKHIFYKYTKKNITINLLRHSIISDLYKSNPSNAKKKTLAIKMGNSVEKQSTYNRIE